MTTAPTFRSVCQFTGTIAEAAAAIDELTTSRDNARAEVDDLMCDLVKLGNTVQQLTKSAGVWQSERDEQRERADEAEEKCDRYLATIDELEAELLTLKTDLAVAHAEAGK